jgi:hypothetical protein
VLIKGFRGGYRYERLQVAGHETLYKDRPAKDKFSHPHDGLQYLCLACARRSRRPRHCTTCATGSMGMTGAERQRQWVAANPERVKAMRAATYARHRAKSIAATAAWQEANAAHVKARKAARYEADKERVNAKNAAWAAANPGKVRLYSHQRRVAESNRTVDWDTELTELATQEAADLSCLREIHTGIKWHIDHVIPLRGRKVSGLHVWNNLAVIPAVENLRKNNSFHV